MLQAHVLFTVFEGVGQLEQHVPAVQAAVCQHPVLGFKLRKEFATSGFHDFLLCVLGNVCEVAMFTEYTVFMFGGRRL
jgi:hypothetical protein